MTSWELILRHTAGGVPDREVFLREWIKRLIDGKREPQPYLRLVGSEGSGKSIFWEALSLLTTVKSVTQAVTSEVGFNGELEGIAVAVIEEIDFSNRKRRRRLADYQKEHITIHRQGEVPLVMQNRLRWVECSVGPGYILEFPVTTFSLQQIDFPIPKPELFARLNSECNAFMGTL